LSSKQDIIERLELQLNIAEQVRIKLSDDPKALQQRDALRTCQAARLAQTHADLLESPRFHDTAQFFLTDIYGPKDLNRHIEQLRRLVPVITKVLGANALEIVADAVELNSLSESLDADMIANLRDKVFKLTEAHYIAAYRATNRREDRERQIDLISHLGHALDPLTRKPLIGTTLLLMRNPAALTGLSDLQNFLERAYAAFCKMKGANEFLTTITTRERELMRTWFAAA